MGPCSNGGWTSERASAVNGGRSEAESTLPGRGAVRVDSGRYAVAEREAAPNLWVIVANTTACTLPAFGSISA